MKTIGIDIDGVLADTTSRWLQEAESQYGIKASRKDITRFKICETFTSLTDGQVLDLFRDVWEEPGRVELEDPAIPSILDTLHERFNISITTATVGAHRMVESWLKLNRINYDRIFYLTEHLDKHAIEGVDIYVDDYSDIVEDVIRNGKTGILLRQPWNEAFVRENRDPRVLVASDWREIENILLTKLL
jgi:5'(3')-deoxyribonucleotidase